MSRKLIYGGIYIGIAIVFPGLPLKGVKSIVDSGFGFWSGIGDEILVYTGHRAKEHIKDSLTQPEGIATKIIKENVSGTPHPIYDIKGPVWKLLNPFE